MNINEFKAGYRRLSDEYGNSYGGRFHLDALCDSLRNLGFGYACNWKVEGGHDIWESAIWAAHAVERDRQIEDHFRRLDSKSQVPA